MALNEIHAFFEGRGDSISFVRTVIQVLSLAIDLNCNVCMKKEFFILASNRAFNACCY